jgi:glutathione S-transferase
MEQLARSTGRLPGDGLTWSRVQLGLDILQRRHLTVFESEQISACSNARGTHMITISAFKMVPPFAQGVVRDLRVRWALEEAGLRYEARFIDPAIQVSPEYRALQPFGQVPSFEEDGLKLFETGAILLHVASRSDALLPTDPTRRVRAIAWVFAALNSMEPSIQQLAEIDFFYPGQEWTKAHRPHIEARVKQRLGELATWLGNREYVEDRFTGADGSWRDAQGLGQGPPPLWGNSQFEAVGGLHRYRACSRAQ